jgi:hypothetical protein
MIVRGEVSALMKKVLRLTEREQRNKGKKTFFATNSFFFAAFLSDFFGYIIILNCKLLK